MSGKVSPRKVKSYVHVRRSPEEILADKLESALDKALDHAYFADDYAWEFGFYVDKIRKEEKELVKKSERLPRPCWLRSHGIGEGDSF